MTDVRAHSVHLVTCWSAVLPQNNLIVPEQRCVNITVSLAKIGVDMNAALNFGEAMKPC